MNTAVAGTMRISSVGVRSGLGAVAILLGIGLITAQIVLARSHQVQAPAPPQVSVVAAATPEVVTTLDRVTFVTGFQAASEISEPLRAEIEVRGVANGTSVLGMGQSGFRIPAEGSRAVYWEWRVPDRVGPGAYFLDVKVLGVNTGTVYGDMHEAATFQVEPRDFGVN